MGAGTWLAVALGGGLGAMGRLALAVWVQRLAGGTFPVGTLTVNLAGCLAIGFLGALVTGPLPLREELRLGLLVGVLGGFTTFSTFGWETVTLLEDGDWARAFANVALSNALGIAGVWLGLRAAQQWGA